MGSAYDGPERRRFPRVKVNFTISYLVNRPLDFRMSVDNVETSALMLDLSQMGMAILTTSNIPVSTILSITFTLINPYAFGDEQRKTMGIIGEVRNSAPYEKNEYRLGIYFKKLSEEDKTAIANFVKFAMYE